MRPDQTRRLLVFVVCGLGVGALYLVPGLAGAPDQLSHPGSSPPSPTATGTISRQLPPAVQETSAAAETQVTARIDTTSDQREAAEPEAGAGEKSALRRPSPLPRRSRTGVDEKRRVDRQQPDPVQSLEVAEATSETLTVRWKPAHDDVAVTSYRVWLNGFEVAETNGLSATVDWFNDDMGQHVLQVRALDAAGNESEASRSVMVTRPAEPTPTRTPPPQPQPGEPTESISASPTSALPTPDPLPTPSTGSRPNSPPSASSPTGDNE